MANLHDLRMSGARDVEHESGVSIHYGENGNSISANGNTFSSDFDSSAEGSEHEREQVRDILSSCRDDRWHSK